MEKKVFEYDFRGRKLVVEIGELAKQSNGAYTGYIIYIER